MLKVEVEKLHAKAEQSSRCIWGLSGYQNPSVDTFACALLQLNFDDMLNSRALMLQWRGAVACVIAKVKRWIASLYQRISHFVGEFFYYVASKLFLGLLLIVASQVVGEAEKWRLVKYRKATCKKWDSKRKKVTVLRRLPAEDRPRQCTAWEYTINGDTKSWCKKKDDKRSVGRQTAYCWEECWKGGRLKLLDDGQSMYLELGVGDPSGRMAARWSTIALLKLEVLRK